MAINQPIVRSGLPLVEAAIATGQFNICPEISQSEPDIVSPIDNPDRANNVMKWNPKTFSFILPDGAAIFCERLQGADPMSQFGNEPVSDLGDWVEDIDYEA